MSRGVIEISPDTSISEAVRKMLTENRKWLVVVNENGELNSYVDREGLLRALVI